MCRQNQLFGFCLMAFGLGVLVGLGLEGGTHIGRRLRPRAKINGITLSVSE